MSKMDQTLDSLNQIVNSVSDSIAKIEAYKDKSSPIYWTQFFVEMDAKIEVHVEQIMNHLNRKEEELQRQSVANPDGHYMVDESTSYDEQAITTLKNGEVVETHVENRKEEQIEAPQGLQRAKGEEVSTEAPPSSTLILETPYEPRAPIPGEESSLLGLLEERKETIKVENFLEYSLHFTPVHNSLPDEKLFENTQRDLPRYADIWNYIYVGKIYSLWSKRRKDRCFKFKLKGQRALSISRMWIPLAWRIPHILTK
jgi:hypothetical protein